MTKRRGFSNSSKMCRCATHFTAVILVYKLSTPFTIMKKFGCVFDYIHDLGYIATQHLNDLSYNLWIF
jgi:hypothetical protein